MRKSKKPSDTTSGDDDVAGLFRRLGADGDAVYRDFGAERLRPTPPPAPTPPARAPAAVQAPAPPQDPAPPPVPLAVAPARMAARAIHAVPAMPAAAGRTPLQQLFDRLAGEGDSPGSESPLRRLRGS